MHSIIKLKNRVVSKIGAIGVIAVSCSNFIILLIVQTHLSPDDFGVFAISQISQQFGMAAVNAIFCSPLVVLFNKENNQSALKEFILPFNFFCIAASLACAGYILALSNSYPTALAMIASCYLNWTRWFLRSIELASLRFLSPAKSDIYYSVALSLASIAMLLADEVSLINAIYIQIFGTILAIFSIRRSAALLFSSTSVSSFKTFRRLLKKHGSWALAGVSASESLSNSHAWLGTALLGPTAYAPIAAVSLFFRPTLVINQALTQYRTPVFSRLIASEELEQLKTGVSSFSRTSLIVTLCNCAAVILIISLTPNIVGGGQYHYDTLLLSAIFLSGAFIARSCRSAQSAALQGDGRFKDLAILTALCSPISISTVVFSATMFPANSEYLLLGVFAGELSNYLLVRARFRSVARRWRSQ